MGNFLLLFLNNFLPSITSVFENPNQLDVGPPELSLYSSHISTSFSISFFLFMS